jgi:hypothetical protein
MKSAVVISPALTTPALSITPLTLAIPPAITSVLKPGYNGWPSYSFAPVITGVMPIID